MQRTLFTFITLFFLISSCSDDDNLRSNTCSVKDPLKDLPWLKAKVEQLKQDKDLSMYFFIEQGTHQGETIFRINTCCTVCDVYFPVYNCNGEALTNLSGGIEDIEVIWRPWYSRCR